MKPVAISDSARSGVALIMVLLVLSALAIIGAPFVISMALQDKASLNFSGAIAARHAAEGARNHAIAQLSKTVYGAEWEEEARVLDAERPRGPILSQKGRSGPFSRTSQAAPKVKKRGMITRRDLGEKSQPKREERRGASRSRGRGEGSSDTEKPGGKESLPDTLRVSKKGPSPREFDLTDEIEVKPAGAVEVPVESAGSAPAAPAKADATLRIRFEDPQGITAAAVIEDEQGKINLNTAPPSLLGNLFGVSQLARPLLRGETTIVLDDASMFRGDSDPGTIDGALVIGDGVGEVVTYRRKSGDVLEDCFRGAYLSLPSQGDFPIGTFVRDLRGLKVAYHRLWAQREGGFHPRELTRFASVESIREIARWQVASLFVTRFRGEGFGPEFLRENGVSPKKLTDLGLDPYIFTDHHGDAGPARKEALEEAKKELRRLRVSGALIQKLLDARGAAVVIDLAARLHSAGKEQVEKVRADLEKSLSSDKRRSPKLPERYLSQALADLAEAYQTPGIETIEPEDLEWLRGSVTVHSHVEAEWSEAQSVLDDVAMSGSDPTARIGRPSELNRGTVLRIRSISDESSVEFNEAAAAAGSGTQGGILLAYPIAGTIKGYDGLIEGLVRHPVNINTASRRVLAAIFTGVRGHEAKEVVTPYEADQLAQLVIKARPLNGHEAFQKVLEDAVRSRVIDGADAQPLLVNAVAPSHSSLSVSTTGFTYASGDVYSIESRGLLRSPAALEIAHTAFREIVEVSAPRRLSLGLLTQADFADGVYLRDPYVGVGSFPENHHQYLLGFPGTRSHLVLTRPLLLHRAPLTFPGGDLGSVRLFPSETPEGSGRWTVGQVYHFRDTYEGLELAHGEAWSLPISVNQSGGSNTPLPPALAPTAGGAAGAASDMDITMVPGGIEFWLRMRTYPEAMSPDGHRILFDSGAETERNRISLLYATKLGRVLLRIHDASIRDVSVVRNAENGQYMEISAQKALELETWYHFRAVWDGVFGGGAQLFIDGFPAGTDNLSTELVSAIPLEGNVASISVKDASKFPREGVVRIDQELFEYTRLGNTLQVRREPPTSWAPLVKAPGSARGRRSIRPPEPPRPPGPPNEADILPQAVPPQGGGVPPAPPPNSDLMRAPWNRRGSTTGAHAANSIVTLHGYSLEVRRKVRLPALLGGSVETQVFDGDSKEIVWGQGGLRCAESLLTFNFPTGTVSIVHADIDPALVGTQGDFVVPLFHFGTGNGVSGGWFIDPLGAILQNGERNAVDYFQSKGVLSLDGTAFLYQKEDLPPPFIAAQARFPQVHPAQTKGLRILGDYPPSPGQDPLAGWRRLHSRTGGGGRAPRVGSYIIGPLTQCSLLASGPIGNLYPRTGVIEIRGAPRASWEAYRPNYSGQPAFGKNPDDVVEWLRYVEIHENMFVGRTGTNYNFRGYPESDRPGTTVDLRKQLDHMAGEPIRLVMELSEGGAGYGDYVTIATSDPNVHEPVPRRVFKTLEHDDGRFFVSLLDVSESGIDMPASPGIYKNTYTRAMNPRLVKFPSWGLPEIRTGSALFFGDSIEGSGSSSARSNTGGVRNNEDEDPTGITIDEVRRFQNRTVRHEPTYGTRVRYVVVPLDGGAVRFQSGGPGKAGISGALPAGRAISRSSPLDILVVSVSRERGLPFLFARGEKEGVLRIGRELFYFEDPEAGEGGGGAGVVVGTARLNGGGNAANPNAQAAPLDDSRQRDPLARTTVYDQIPVSNMTGRFEEEGFARLADRHVERRDFYEVFYYRKRQGGFSQCLRGQFGTPIALSAVEGTIHNVTRKLRLVARGLLGSEPAHHALGDSVAFVPYATVSPVTGPLTPTGLPVKDAKLFARPGGYILLDPATPGAPWEILGHLGPAGDALLACARDERGRPLFRASFGTKERPISNEILAYEMPYRYPDRYESEADSESLAYLQKSYRVPGAYWRSIGWLERPPRTLQDRRVEILVALRFDGTPAWDSKPTNTPGGLYTFQAEEGRDKGQGPVHFDIDRVADQVELRVYFHYLSGAFTRLPGNHLTDDWKETPVLEALTLEYEKAGTVVRHEELPF